MSSFLVLLSLSLFSQTYPPTSLTYKQLPTLYFSVLMFAHLLDHFIFSSRRLSLQSKQIAFGAIAGAIMVTFWWFKGLAFGVDGPITDHWGLEWRRTWNIYNH